MNWLTKIKILGDKIKKNLQKKFPTKEEIANSDWTSCCKGPILKKDLEDNLWICNSCGNVLAMTTGSKSRIHGRISDTSK